MISRRYIVYVILSLSLSLSLSRSARPRNFFCDPRERNGAWKGEEERSRVERKRERKGILLGKTMIGRRSLETCLLGPGKCTSAPRDPRFTRRQAKIGAEKCVPRGTFFLLMSRQPRDLRRACR